MSKMVERYIELAKKRSADLSDSEDKQIVDSMRELKKSFEKSDWERLIDAVPTHMKPMIKEQMKQYLND